MSAKVPLVSVTLFTYNQERFVRQAVEGAFAQDFSPLEIILSDDCSTDQTFAIMKEMVAAYQGPHHVILNRTPSNLGVAKHIDVVVKMSQGAWIIPTAGDDISCPTRVSRLMEIVAQYPCAFGIGSGWKNIDENGYSLPPDLDHQGRSGVVVMETVDFEAQRFVLHGASTAYKREIYTEFKAISPDVFHDDMVLTFRGLLCGQLVAIPDELVLYRKWSGSASAGSNDQGESHYEKALLREKRSSRWHKSLAATYRQMQIDLDTTCDAKKQMGSAEISRIRGEIEKRIRKYELIGRWDQYPSGKRFVEMLKNPQHLQWTVPRIFGIDFFAKVYAMMKKVLNKK